MRPGLFTRDIRQGRPRRTRTILFEARIAPIAAAVSATVAAHCSNVAGSSQQRWRWVSGVRGHRLIPATETGQPGVAGDPFGASDAWIVCEVTRTSSCARSASTAESKFQVQLNVVVRAGLRLAQVCQVEPNRRQRGKQRALVADEDDLRESSRFGTSGVDLGNLVEDRPFSSATRRSAGCVAPAATWLAMNRTLPSTTGLSRAA